MSKSRGVWRKVAISDHGDFSTGNVLSFEEFIEGDKDQLEISSKKHRRIEKELAMPLKKKEFLVDEKLEDFSINGSPWLSLGLLESISRKLIKRNIATPTEVQAKCFHKIASFKKNTIICSPTGTGKTLAYLLPVLDYLIRYKINELKGIKCLILLPTRELALQVYKECDQICEELMINFVLFIGGLSEQKQMRILRQRKPSIIIGTPGRIWMILSGKYDTKDEKAEKELLDFSKMKMLVVDEADRLTECGHFEDLNNIMNHLYKICKTKFKNCVASATLSLGKKKDDNSLPKLKQLSESLKVDINDWQSVKVDDLIVPVLLQIKKIDCLDEKDRYVKLYKMLLALRASKKNFNTIIFLNTITLAKQLQRIMKSLLINMHILHGKQQQKNRLKNLDRFINQKSNESSNILIATDVAAHGLDMSGGVDIVLHFSTPMNKESFVHRSGRCARAGKSGQTVIFQIPSDIDKYKDILKSIDRDKTLLETYDELSEYKMAKSLMFYALEMESFTSQLLKIQTNQQWFKKNSELADIEIDEDYCDIDKKKYNEDEIRQQITLLKKKIASIFRTNKI